MELRMPTNRSIPIVILAGQSNALRSGVSTGVSQAAADNNAIFLQSAVSGSPLDARLDTSTGDWNACGEPGTGELLNGLIAQIRALTDPTSATYIEGAYFAGIDWVQGEADAWSAAAASSYARNLTAVDNILTANFGPHRFVVSQLSDNAGSLATDSAQRVENWHTIQSQQATFASSGVGRFLVNPDSLAKFRGIATSSMFVNDGLHYSQSFGSVLGNMLGSSVFNSFTQGRAAAGAEIHSFIGTSADDTFIVSALGLSQAFGAGGTDTIRFSNLSFGINLVGSGSQILQARASDIATDFTVNIVSIEKLFLTAQSDNIVLDANTLRIAAGAGNDTMLGSSQADTAWMDGGNDLFSGRSGDDTAYGGTGSDTLRGGVGHDKLYGGDNQDFLNGDEGNDWLSGGSGNDTIVGGAGNDQSFGGSGSDTFVFAAIHGKDQINDFDAINNHTASHDRIDFSQVPGFRSFDAMITSTHQQGHDVLIFTAPDNYIRLTHVALSDLDAGDFLFSS
ncbi:MAG: hypothetical protein CFE33_04905 [Pseudorhodobacter sp. PARRP1]|nr:MAG: hypothetical protein CFE33_04905 [Pseudorhodobacter sp. PARRP1]